MERCKEKLNRLENPQQSLTIVPYVQAVNKGKTVGGGCISMPSDRHALCLPYAPQNIWDRRSGVYPPWWTLIVTNESYMAKMVFREMGGSGWDTCLRMSMIIIGDHQSDQTEICLRTEQGFIWFTNSVPCPVHTTLYAGGGALGGRDNWKATYLCRYVPFCTPKESSSIWWRLFRRSG